MKARISTVHVEGDGGNDTVIVDDRSGDTTDYRLAVALPALVGIDLHFDESNRISLGDDVQVLRLLLPQRLHRHPVSAMPRSMQLRPLRNPRRSGSDKLRLLPLHGTHRRRLRRRRRRFDHIDYSTTALRPSATAPSPSRPTGS